MQLQGEIHVSRTISLLDAAKYFINAWLILLTLMIQVVSSLLPPPHATPTAGAPSKLGITRMSQCVISMPKQLTCRLPKPGFPSSDFPITYRTSTTVHPSSSASQASPDSQHHASSCIEKEKALPPRSLVKTVALNGSPPHFIPHVATSFPRRGFPQSGSDRQRQRLRSSSPKAWSRALFAELLSPFFAVAYRP